MNLGLNLGTRRRAIGALLIGVLGVASSSRTPVLAQTSLPTPESSTSAPASPVTTSFTAPVIQRVATVTVRLQLIPSTALATFSAPDMASVTAKAGTVKLPAGRMDMTVTAPGFQRVSRSVVAGRVMTARLDPVGQLHRHRWDARTGSNPKQVAFTPDGKELWVPLLGSRGVDVFRSSDGSKLTTVQLGNKHGAVEVIFNKAGTRAYVSQMQTASVFEVDTVSKRVLRHFFTNGNWTKVLALSPDESTLFAANWVSNDVSVISLSTGRLVRRISTVRTPRGLAFDATGGRLFVAGFDGGEIQRITLATPMAPDIKKTIFRTGGAMRHLAVDYSLNRLYADDMGTGLTYVMDMDTEQMKTLAPVDSHPNTIDLNPSGRFLYVSNRGANNAKGYNIPGPEWGSVVVIDTKTGALVDAIIGGNQTTGLDVSDDGRFVAFTDFLDNRLAVYEIPLPEVLEAGKGGLAPTRRRLIAK